jgi:hypothetical protein
VSERRDFDLTDYDICRNCITCEIFHIFLLDVCVFMCRKYVGSHSLHGETNFAIIQATCSDKERPESLLCWEAARNITASHLA